MNQKHILKTMVSALVLVALLVALQPANPVRAAPPAAADGQSRHIAPGQTPDGLSTAEWQGIQEQIAAGKYRAYAADGGGYVSSNPAQGCQV
jgi:hypothetical protein